MSDDLDRPWQERRGIETTDHDIGLVLARLNPASAQMAVLCSCSLHHFFTIASRRLGVSAGSLVVK